MFCHSTGARPSAVRTARWSDLKLEEGVIVFKDHKTIKTQRMPKPRIIYLPDEVLSLLVAISQRQPSCEFIFVSRLGRPYHRNSIAQNLKRLREKIGLPDDVKLYSCRYGPGTGAVLRDENMADLAQLMGHSKGSRITDHYVHLDNQTQHLRDVLTRINREP